MLQDNGNRQIEAFQFRQVNSNTSGTHMQYTQRRRSCLPTWLESSVANLN